MLRTRLVVASCVLCLAVPAAAEAQNAPPGNSGVDQYLETVPDAGGDRAPRGDGGAGPRAGRPRPSGMTDGLEAAGPDGVVLERLVASAPPRRASSMRRSSGAGGVAGAGATSGDAGAAPPKGEDAPRSTPGAVVATSLTGSGSGGMGSLLPVLLGLVTLGTIALALHRRRS